MARNSSAASFGKGVLGVGAGFALYMLITGFGGGGGFGWGGGGGKQGVGAGEGKPSKPVTPGPNTGPVRSRVLLTAEGVSVDGKKLPLDAAIEAIRGAHDVEVVVTGDSKQGDVDDLLVALFLAGITWRGSESLVRSAPRGMDDVRRVQEAKRRSAEWDKLSEAEKKQRIDDAIEDAKRSPPPTDEEVRKIVERSRAPKVGNARGCYGRGRYG